MTVLFTNGMIAADFLGDPTGASAQYRCPSLGGKITAMETD
jgi:hypothetical protein